MILTAKLTINYRRPVVAENCYLARVRVDRVVGKKKVYLTATVEDEKGRVCVEASSLYIIKADRAAKKGG